MDSNFDALDAYNKAWVSGDSAEIYPLLADSYTLRLGEDGELITKSVFIAEWKKFRKMVEEAGGPKVSQNGNFIKTTNAVLKELGDYAAVEGADWSIENFGTGVYMCAAKDGKILWEEVSV